MDIVIEAKFDGDTRRMHRFTIQNNEYGIQGSIYIFKDMGETPKQITVELTTSSRGIINKIEED